MKVGRKSYWESKIEPRLVEIAGWCRDGHVNKDIAKMLGVSEKTFYKYLLVKSELIQALKENKAIADLAVENSLYKRAIGYEYKEVTKEIRTNKEDAVTSKHVKTVTKQVAPDTTAQIFWLKNRKQEQWREQRKAEDQQQPMIFNVNLGKKKDG